MNLFSRCGCAQVLLGLGGAFGLGLGPSHQHMVHTKHWRTDIVALITTDAHFVFSSLYILFFPLI